MKGLEKYISKRKITGKSPPKGRYVRFSKGTVLLDFFNHYMPQTCAQIDIFAEEVDGKYLSDEYRDFYWGYLLKYSIVYRENKLVRPTVFIYPKQVHELIEMCDKRFFIMSLATAENMNRGIPGAPEKWIGGHSSILIIDRAKKVIEHFNPDVGGKGNRFFYTYMENNFPEYTYVQTWDNCPHIAPQRIFDTLGGICSIYSTLYAVLRVLNPEKHGSDIIKFISSGTRDEIRDRVLGFGAFMADAIKEIDLPPDEGLVWVPEGGEEKWRGR